MRRSNRNTDQENMNTGGSPSQGEPLYLCIGRIRRPHGFGGELLMEILTDFPERIHKGQVVFIGPEKTPMEVLRFKGFPKSAYITFNGINDEQSSGDLRNKYVFIKNTDLPSLPEGHYYHHQILNCTVMDEDQKVLGILQEILITGSKDVYLVRDSEGKELLLPALDSVILNVDLQKNIIIVRPPEWE